MVSRKSTTAIFLLLAAWAIGSARAGEPVEGKNNKVTFDGLVWTSYKYVLEDASPSDEQKDLNAFAVDRVYLTLTSQLAERYTARGRVEMGNLNTGAPTAFVKTADIQVADPFGAKGTKLRFGQTEGVVTGWYEKMMAYRIVSKMPTERYLGIGSTYLGAGWAGKWASGLIETDLLVANRVSYSGDVAEGGKANPKFKTLSGRAYIRPIRGGAAKGIGIGGYAQYAPRVVPAADNNDLWFGGHAFFEASKGTVGLAYDAKTTKADGKDVTAAIISGSGRLGLTEKDELFARVDLVDFDTNGSDYTMAEGAKAGDAIEKKLAQTVVMAGLSHSYSKTLRGIVDLSARSFQDKLYGPPSAAGEIKPDTEFVISARLDATL
jgi:hypothetical protein